MDNEIDLKIKLASKLDTFYLIFEILQGNSNVFLSKSILKLLNLKIKEFYLLDENTKKKQLKNAVNKLYSEKLEKMKNTIAKFEKIWLKNKQNIQQGFLKVFGNFQKQECVAMATFNNRIFTRYLDAKAFNFYYKFNEYDFLQNAIHEITHFIWFDKLKILMPEIERKDYESPSSVWMFSEIAVDMVFENNEFFKSIAIKTGDKPAYNHFYNDKIGNVTIIDYFRKLFKKCKTMDEFIVKGTKESLALFK